MNPDITLAICMYNAERYMEETLRCVMEQTMQDFHLLIVDDCSTDNSVNCVKQFFDTHPRQYELICLECNEGIAYARDFALRRATTKYMLYVDSDDCPLPQLIEKEYAAICSDQELIAVSSWSQFVDTNCNPIRGGLFIGDKDKKSFMERAKAAKRIFLPIQTMFDRGCALQVGGFRLDGFPQGKPRYRDFCEDLDLWTRMSDLYAEGKYMIVLPEVLYLYRKIDGLSSNHFNMVIKMEYVKANLRHRRKGEKEITFIEYYNSLPKKELQKMIHYSKSADELRNAAFYFHQKTYFKAVVSVIKSLWHQPSYLFQKLRSNSGIKKKQS